MPDKAIKRSILVKGAEVLECIYLKDLPGQTTMGDIRSMISKIITDDELAEFRSYCKASTEYEIIEDL